MNEYTLSHSGKNVHTLSNTTPTQAAKAGYYTWNPKVAVIRKELVALTGDPDIAVVLNQLLYWSQRIKDYDLLVEEEKTLFHQENIHEQEEQVEDELGSPILAQHGWFYKSTPELIEETLLCVSRVTMRRYLKVLLERGWVQERGNSKYKYDKTTHYRVNLYQLNKDLQAIGYGLPGFTLREEIKEQTPQKTSMLKTELSSVQNFTFESKEGEHSEVSAPPFAPQAGKNLQKTSMLNSELLNVQNFTFEGKESEHVYVSTPPSSSQTSENPQKTSMSKTEPSNVQNFAFESKESEHVHVSTPPSSFQTNENPQKTSTLKTEPSSVQNFTFEGKESEHSNVKKWSFITENKTENINREKHRASVRAGVHVDAHTHARGAAAVRDGDLDGNFDVDPGKARHGDSDGNFGASCSGGAGETFSEVFEVNDDESLAEAQKFSSSQGKIRVAALMIDLWRRHVNSEAIVLTDGRKQRLESLLGQHFQSDLRAWERFCLRVKTSPFLMGEGKRQWLVTLDWILSKGNLLRVLEGRYDDPEQAVSQKNEAFAFQQDRETRQTLDSIQDLYWKNWCSQLLGIHPVTGGPLVIEGKAIEAVLTVSDVKRMRNARFKEREGRLVWVECPDNETVNAIENLRFKILPVVQATFPGATCVRTELLPIFTPSTTRRNSQ